MPPRDGNQVFLELPGFKETHFDEYIEGLPQFDAEMPQLHLGTAEFYESLSLHWEWFTMARPITKELGCDAVGERSSSLPVNPRQELFVEQKAHFFADPYFPPGQVFIVIVSGPELEDQGNTDEAIKAF